MNVNISKAHYDSLVEGIIAIGDEIRRKAALPLRSESKPDDSPVTAVDRYAHQEICALLAELTPDIPVLSEEGTPVQQDAAARSQVKWVVDPLDGTRTLLSYSQGQRDRDSFGIHLALVDHGVPVCGIAHFPAMDEGRGVTYFTDKNGEYAFRKTGESEKQRISVVPRKGGEPLRAAVHHTLARRPENLCGLPYHAEGGVGGQRLCLAAEGKVHLADMNDIPAAVAHEKGYKQWDVAAGHAILKAAGGELVLAETRQPLSYAYVPDDDYRVPGCYGASLSVLQTLGLLTSAPPRER